MKMVFKNIPFILVIVALVSLASFVSLAPDAFAALGLPCPDGGPGFRDQMTGYFPPRFERFDQTGEEIRYSPGFDAIYRAQCIDPKSLGALNQLFSILQQDVSDGIIQKCTADDAIVIDSYGNIQLCSDEADSYITITDGQWNWAYYEESSPVNPTGTPNYWQTPPPTTPDPGPTAPPPEIDTGVPGWDGVPGYNPLDDTFLVVSTGAAAGAQGAYGQVFGNDGVPRTQSFRIDQAQFFAGSPHAIWVPPKRQWLVVWIQEANAQGSSSDLYARFVNPDGSFAGESFNITPNDPNVPLFYANSKLNWDARNQRVVFAFENRNPDMIAVFMKSIGANGEIGPTVEVDFNPGDFIGAPSLTVNEELNEYCVSYQYAGAGNWEPGASNASALGIKRVSATNFDVGPRTFASQNLFFNGSIVYSPVQKQYLAVWTDYQIQKGLGVVLNSCNGADINTNFGDENGIIEFGFAGGMPGLRAEYNPTSNTYAVIAQDYASFKNKYMIFTPSMVMLDQGYIFLNKYVPPPPPGSDVPEGGGNFNPVFVANTRNGTFAAFSSVDYAWMRFQPNVGHHVLAGKRYDDVAPDIDNPPIEIEIPTEGLPNFGDMIEGIFTWSLNLLGLAVFIMFFYAGFLRLTSAGNTGKIGQANNIMRNAAIGAVILLCSYVILRTINPDLVGGVLTLPRVESP